MTALCFDVQLIDVGRDDANGGAVGKAPVDVVIVIVMVEAIASFSMGSAAGTRTVPFPVEQQLRAA